MKQYEKEARALYAKHMEQARPMRAAEISDGWTLERDEQRAINAMVEMYENFEYLHRAFWQALDDMGVANYVCVCEAAKDQMIDAYIKTYGDEGDAAPEAVRKHINSGGFA